MTKRDVLNAALDLPDDERADLVDDLVQSLGPAKLSEVDLAWAAEAESRIDAYEAGEMVTHSAEEVFAALRDRLAR